MTQAFNDEVPRDAIEYGRFRNPLPRRQGRVLLAHRHRGRACVSAAMIGDGATTAVSDNAAKNGEKILNGWMACFFIGAYPRDIYWVSRFNGRHNEVC